MKTAVMKTLTNEQLCMLAQAGDEQAQSQLIENNIPFIQQMANRIAGGPSRQEQFSSCGIDVDDLVQSGSIGLWRSIAGYDLSSGSKFLTYAAPAIKRSMSELIHQYSRDTVWRLKREKDCPWKIIYLDEPLADSGEDTVESLISSLSTKLPEQILIEQETIADLHEAIDVLPDRENVYVQYRFGFADGEPHPLTESAQYFRLTVSRAKSVERSALKILKQELLFEIPERALAQAEDRLTRRLVADGELHAVELRLKSQRKRGKKITAVVYKYLADYDGAWGEISYDFKTGNADISLLAEWDAMLSHRFAMRAIEYLKAHHKNALPDKIILTFISSEKEWLQ